MVVKDFSLGDLGLVHMNYIMTVYLKHNYILSTQYTVGICIPVLQTAYV